MGSYFTRARNNRQTDDGHVFQSNVVLERSLSQSKLSFVKKAYLLRCLVFSLRLITIL